MADALCMISMNIVARVEDGKKELVKDVCHLTHLGVKLSVSSKGGILVHNGLESFVLV